VPRSLLRPPPEAPEELQQCQAIRSPVDRMSPVCTSVALPPTQLPEAFTHAPAGQACPHHTRVWGSPHCAHSLAHRTVPHTLAQAVPHTLTQSPLSSNRLLSHLCSLAPEEARRGDRSRASLPQPLTDSPKPHGVSNQASGTHIICSRLGAFSKSPCRSPTATSLGNPGAG